jgi:hypothetical protein
MKLKTNKTCIKWQKKITNQKNKDQNKKKYIYNKRSEKRCQPALTF